MVLTLQEVEGGPEENAVTASAPPSADDAVLTPTERHLKAAFGVQYAPLRGHSASLWGEYDAAGRASSLLGSVVHVRWPHLDQGIIVSISDATKEVVWLPPAGYDFVGTPKFDTPGRPASREVRHSVQAQHVWSHDARHAQELALSGGLNLAICGIDIGPGEAGCVFSCTHDVGCSRLRCWLVVGYWLLAVTCTHTTVELLIKVRLLTSMHRNPTTGAHSRVFANAHTPNEIVVPGQLVLKSHPSPDTRFSETPPLSIKELYPSGSRVVILRGKLKGMVGQVRA